jgi:pimeloyl-ACP methyl ester carboxylesterase
MRVVYLHGFASGPQSGKAQFFRKRFEERGIAVEIPQLDQGDFEHITVSGMLGVIDGAVRGEPVVLMGSSLGGYLAGLYAARNPNVERLILLAPAFQFPSRWRERHQEQLAEWKRDGSLPFFHYGFGDERPLGYSFVEDSSKYEDQPDFDQAALVIHGVHDTVVPIEVSRHFCSGHRNARLHEVDSGHELTDVLEQLWAQTALFLPSQNR